MKMCVVNVGSTKNVKSLITKEMKLQTFKIETTFISIKAYEKSSFENILKTFDLIVYLLDPDVLRSYIDVGRLIEAKKPTLVLTPDRVSLFELRKVLHWNNRMFFNLFKIELFSTQVESFIRNALKLLHSKFLFNIDPNMKEYLDWYSDNNNTSRVDLIRSLLNASMLEDRDWNEYKNGNE